MKVKTRRDEQERRRIRIRKKVYGTAERPRLCVKRSLRHSSAQLIDDVSGTTLVSASSIDPGVKEEVGSTGTTAAAAKVGQLIAQRARERGIERAVFDRNGNQYHGRVRSIAEAARAAGLRL